MRLHTHTATLVVSTEVVLSVLETRLKYEIRLQERTPCFHEDQRKRCRMRHCIVLSDVMTSASY